jgi:hypothetical protein
MDSNIMALRQGAHAASGCPTELRLADCTGGSKRVQCRSNPGADALPALVLPYLDNITLCKPAC